VVRGQSDPDSGEDVERMYCKIIQVHIREKWYLQLLNKAVRANEERKRLDRVISSCHFIASRAKSSISPASVASSGESIEQEYVLLARPRPVTFQATKGAVMPKSAMSREHGKARLSHEQM
jgi:hypothetical protein